jgi:phosphoglucomutase
MAATRQSVAEVVQAHWQRFGRSYYQRHDYEGLEALAATRMVEDLRDKLASLVGIAIADSHVARADDFSYTDPVDGAVSTRQGLRILLADGARIVIRLSGTGTEGATLRLYVERFREDGGDSAIAEVLDPLIHSARELLELRERCGIEEPTVIT